MSSSARSRDLGEARRAFAFSEGGEQEVARQLSHAAHSIISAEPKGALASAGWTESGHNEELTHRSASLMLRGGLEGMMLSMSLLSLANGAGWPTSFTLSFSLAVVVTWATFSACREALDTITYRTHYNRERSREAWELANFPEGEVAEMVQLYSKKGLTEAAAKQVVETMATSTDFFVDVMMSEELQMAPPSEISEWQAASRVGGGVLVCGGTLPLCFALFSLSRPGPAAFSLLLGVALAGLAYLGALRASITHQDKRRLALQTAALVLPCTLLPHLAGGHLASLAL